MKANPPFAAEQQRTSVHAMLPHLVKLLTLITIQIIGSFTIGEL